jgi:hypothetical protein
MDLPDYLGSKYHSQKLANKIRAYYRKRGHEVPVEVFKEGSVYVIRCNFQFAPPTPQSQGIHD